MYSFEIQYMMWKSEIIYQILRFILFCNSLVIIVFYEDILHLKVSCGNRRRPKILDELLSRSNSSVMHEKEEDSSWGSWMKEI